MSNKSTEANFHVVTPQGGVNQRDDIASLDEKTFSNIEGLVPKQTGMLERNTGKATLAKYADAVWGIAQCWTPAGLIAGYNQYGGSLTYQPWALTWGPIDVSLPPWIGVDTDNYTLPPMSGGGGTASTGSSSGAAGGSGAGGFPHWEWQTNTLVMTNSVPYKGDAHFAFQITEQVTCPVSGHPPTPNFLNPVNLQISNGTSAFYARIDQMAYADYGSCNNTTHLAPVYTQKDTLESHNLVTFTTIGKQPKIAVWVGIKTSLGTYTYNLTYLDLPEGTSTLNTFDLLPDHPTVSSSTQKEAGTSIDNSDSHVPSDQRGKYKSLVLKLS